MKADPVFFDIIPLAFDKLSNASLEGGAEVSNLCSNDEAFAKNAIPPSTILHFPFS